jgi:ATP-binding cassette subfamily B protein
MLDELSARPLSAWTVRTADRILVLKGGELVDRGTHEALVSLGGLYSELFQLQAAGYR